MKISCVIVSRMGSTRIPGKAMTELCKKPMLWHIINRAFLIKDIDNICLATTDLEIDTPLVEIAQSCGILVFRGHPEFVLDRVYGAAKSLGADVIVEIGGDAPLFDPKIISDAIQIFIQNGLDYLYNYDPPTYPEGMDINIISAKALEIAYHEAIAPSQRIHPFSYIPMHRAKFKIKNYEYPIDLSTYHWSVDYPDDVQFVRMVYDRLYDPHSSFGFQDILALIEHDNVVAQANQRLLRPVTKNAFWNSPGIIRDMNDDLVSLAEKAKRELEQNKYDSAMKCYSEVINCAAHLQRYTEFKSHNSNHIIQIP